jgi:hypothetical protein
MSPDIATGSLPVGQDGVWMMLAHVAVTIWTMKRLCEIVLQLNVFTVCIV